MKLWRLLGGRKFLAFVIACVFFLLGKLSENAWLMVFAVYTSANVVGKLLKRHEVERP